MNIKQFEPFIGSEEYDAIKSCFDRNWITEGPKSVEFVERFLDLIGCKYGVLAPNGTLALYLGLRALGIGPSDEVLVPNFTFIASANAIEMCGATPVFVDINIEDFQINIKDCERLVTSRTKAIMPVHLYGLAANMDEVLSFSSKNNLKVIEDAAQAVEVRWNDQHCGAIGDVGCFSFFADKTITTGEGGFVATNDPETYNQLLYLRNQGRKERGSFIHPEIGYNFRLTDIQAAIGIAQLKKLPDIIEKKLSLLDYYKSHLEALDEVSVLEPTNPLSNHIPFRIVLRSSEHISPLSDFLQSKNIETRTVFHPLHKQPCYSVSTPDSEFPNSLHAYSHATCLPSYPALGHKSVDYICDSIKSYYAV